MYVYFEYWLLITLILLRLLFFVISWLLRSGKNRGKTKIFKVREKSGNFLKSRGKSLVLSKSVKGQGILFSGL